MKNKLLSILLTICMVALLLPVSVIHAYAETEETKTFTISNAVGDPNNGYCGTITYDGYDFLIPGANIMQNQFYNNGITMRANTGGNEGTVKLYPRISGKVKSLTFSSARVMFSELVGTEHYVKIGKGDIWTNSYTEDMSTATTLTFTFTNGDGLQLANENDYLEIKMRNSETTRRASFAISGTLTITYEPTASTLTHTHNFSYNVAGNTLTATCAHDDGKECDLASSNYQVSTSLMAPTFLIFVDGWNYPASMSGFENFKSETGATIGSITYIKTDTNEDYGTSEPNATGTYTASVTITAGGTGYTLQTSYRVTDYHFVYNNYPQFTITTDKEGNYAGNGQTVTITFTSQFDETLTGLTVTGATTNYSIGSGITDNGSNTYTFTMPGEDVTIGATFSISEDDFAQSGDTYTIKTANGWGWFCFTVSYGLAPNGYSGKTVVLAASVGSSEMAGTSDHPFKGTFDGQGNTLTFNLQAGEDYSAPFHYTNGATIKNLHVEGTITGGDNTSLGGLVGKATGNITIENCRVSTKISTTHSGPVWHGGVIALWYDSNVACTVTGCVYDGLIYNPSEADATTYCNGFIGNLFGSNLTVTFTDCLYAPAAYGTGEYAPGDNCYTFVYPNSSPTYNMTNCYYTTALGKRQGRPAATANDAPANLGGATTDHGLVKGYLNGFLYNGNYYTPKYGDAVVEYVFNDLWEHADVTINGQGDNLVGVNITEEVGNVTSVTYNRTFTSGVAAAVILPFDYTCNGNEGGSFYSFAGISGATPVMEDGNHVTSLTANTPYLFVPTATAMTFPNISKMTDGVVTLKPTAGDHTVTSGDWTLTGIYAPKTWTGIEPDYDNAFILNSIGKLNHISFDEMVKPTDGYFVGSVITYTVTFDANGGTGTIAAETVTGGATYTLPDCTFTAPEGKTFFAWSVKIGDAEAVNKQPGDTITVTEDTTVTATWEWRLQDGYYLIGQNGWTADDIDAAQVFTVNPANANEYMLETTLAVGDEIKVVRVANGAIAQWFPDPGDNYTVAADYAGSVTIYFKTTYDSAWSAFGGHIWIVKKAPTFATQSLILSGQIGLSFNMDLPDIEGVDWTESWMTFAIPHGTCTERADYADSSAKKSGNRGFVCYVNAIQMAEPITATFHWIEGEEEKTIEKTYAIKDYFFAYDAKKDTFLAPVQKLIESTADYGHYTQAYLADVKGWTLGEDGAYYGMDKFYTEAYDYTNTATGLNGYGFTCENNGADIRNLSFATVLDSATAIRLLITPTSGYTGTFTAEADQGKEANVSKAGKRYSVEIQDVMAHELSKTYTITVTTEGGTATITVSALSYIKLLFNANEGALARDAASAILGYATAAYNLNNQN